MILRIVYAVIAWIVVALVCILVGTLLGAIGVPPTEAVGSFLGTYAWVIGGLVALLYFLRGGLPGLP